MTRSDGFPVSGRISLTFSNRDSAEKWLEAFAPLARAKKTVVVSNISVRKIKGNVKLTFDYHHNIYAARPHDLNRFIQRANARINAEPLGTTIKGLG